MVSEHEVESREKWHSTLLQVGVRDWESLATSPSRIQKGFCETVAEVMDAEVEREDEIHLSKRPRVAERVSIQVPPEVEPQNCDFNVNEFLRSNLDPVVVSILEDSEIIQRAAVRRGYPVMKFRFLNFGADIHDQSVKERTTNTMQRNPVSMGQQPSQKTTLCVQPVL